MNELEGMMSFDTLGLAPALTRAVADAGYAQPTDVQQRAIPPALEGRDLRVSSATGSGKTASFVLPALQRVIAARAAAPKARCTGPRVLVLAPTRELAISKPLTRRRPRPSRGRLKRGRRLCCSSSAASTWSTSRTT